MEQAPILTQPIFVHEPSRKRRALAAVGVVSFFAALGAFGTATDEPPPPQELVVQQLALPSVHIGATDDPVYWQETNFERSDTFASLLRRLGVDSFDAARLIKEHSGAKPFKNLRPGMSVQARVSAGGELIGLRFTAPAHDMVLGFERNGEQFQPVEERSQPRHEVVLRSGQVGASLFGSADEVGLPDSVMTQLADIFSGDIDFNRDVQRGDRFAVVYETLYHEGQPLRAGRVLAAEFVNDGRVHRAVWFVDDRGKGGYYTPDGKNVQPAFLRSPLELSRVTSGFTVRMHPFANEWRAHKGVDYAAPTGTRVRATADGIVEFAGVQNGYGNVIILKHDGDVSTLYAHLSGFAASVQEGAHVSQGELIGYVGSTGWATGPHLHYEFRVRNEYRNPLKVAMPANEPLPDRLRAEFRAEARSRVGQLALLSDVTLAGLE